MEDTDKKLTTSRRRFLETGLAGLALGIAASKILPLSQEEEEAPEMVKMLTADGKLVEVSKQHLPPMCGKAKAVSNNELLAWMETGKQ